MAPLVVHRAGWRWSTSPGSGTSRRLCTNRLRRDGIDATPASALPFWDHDRYFTGVELARAIDDAGFRRRLAPGLARAAAGADVVVVPAVLGLNRGHEPWADLQSLVGVPLVEAATPRPRSPACACSPPTGPAGAPGGALAVRLPGRRG